MAVPGRVQHVVEVAADQQPLLGGPVGGAEGQAGHPRQRRLQQAGAQHAGGAHLARVERCGRHRDARTLGELVHQGGVAGRRGGPDRSVPHQDERARGHAVAGKRHDRADRGRRHLGTTRTGRGGRPRRGVRPRCVGQVVRQQRCVGLLTAQRGHHRCGQFPGSGAARSAPSRTVPRPPTRPRPRPSTRATRPRRPAPARRRPARPPSSPSARGAGTGPASRWREARNRDRDRSTSRVSSRPCCSVTSSTYQAAQPSARYVAPRVQPAPARGELDLARCVTVGEDRPSGDRARPTSSSPTRRFGSRADAVAFTKRITPWSSWARMPLPAPSRSWSARVRPDRAHVVRRAPPR